MIPRIQLHQQYATLGMDADIGTQDLQQPRATVEMKQLKPELNISREKGRFEADQTRAWEALGLGNNLETMSKIYSQAKDIALQGLARIVDAGNRMADFHNPGNPFAEFARSWRQSFPEFETRGEASYDNVDIYITPDRLHFNPVNGHVEMDVVVNPPIHRYERGKLDFYMIQHAQLEISPPTIDVTI